MSLQTEFEKHVIKIVRLMIYLPKQLGFIDVECKVYIYLRDFSLFYDRSFTNLIFTENGV